MQLFEEESNKWLSVHPKPVLNNHAWDESSSRTYTAHISHILSLLRRSNPSNLFHSLLCNYFLRCPNCWHACFINTDYLFFCNFMFGPGNFVYPNVISKSLIILGSVNPAARVILVASGIWNDRLLDFLTVTIQPGPAIFSLSLNGWRLWPVSAESNARFLIYMPVSP